MTMPTSSAVMPTGTAPVAQKSAATSRMASITWALRAASRADSGTNVFRPSSLTPGVADLVLLAVVVGDGLPLLHLAVGGIAQVRVTELAGLGGGQELHEPVRGAGISTRPANSSRPRMITPGRELCEP